MPEKTEERTWQCCIDNEIVRESDIYKHKQKFHPDRQNYGVMWYLPDIGRIRKSIDIPEQFKKESEEYKNGKYNMWNSLLMQKLLPVKAENVVSLGESGVQIAESDFLARELGVRKVYIRDEGRNPSGSMKDYIVSCGVTKARQEGYKHFTAVSCGNHALSAARYVQKIDGQIIVFITSGSTKTESLRRIPNTYVCRVKTNGRDSLYEEVYERFYNPNNGLYNLNVSNEFLLDGAKTVALEMALSGKDMPTHFISCAGNGTYLAGVSKGFLELKELGIIEEAPKCVAVGMEGGFPIETALQRNLPILEYKDFLAEESKINFAEGTMAIGSYSMPLAISAIKASEGFTIGGMENDTLREAYILLSRDEILMKKGCIPEPTGIQSLAAVMKHKKKFSGDDMLLLSFTGHGAKNLKEIHEILGKEHTAEYEILSASAISSQGRPDLATDEDIILDSQVSQSDLDKIISRIITRGENQ
ncbi:MAG: pyridoxal-phosphate dependent enzyme [Candidatus Woesearchaeota archaeon]